MSSTGEKKLTRRHLLQLVGAGGAALVASGAALAQATSSPAKKAAAPSALGGTSLSLFLLASGMIGTRPGAKLLRKQFDRHPADTITKYGLNEDEWFVFVQMNKNGAEIRDEAAKELISAGYEKRDVDDWKQEFETFVTDWAKYCDDYDYLDKECVVETGGTACPTPTPGPAKEKDSPVGALYQGPHPKVDERDVKPAGGKKYRVYGEGFLPGAVVELRATGGSPPDPNSPYSASFSEKSTFRCSRLTFEPKVTGTYDVYVINKFGSKSFPLLGNAKLKI